jgi:hypothetical protein
VYVRDPGGRHWAIPYADLGRPPIALWELVEARKSLRDGRRRDHTEREIFASILEQRRITKEAARRTQQRRRQERVPHAPPASVPGPTEAKTPASELKPYPVEIWEDD